MRLHNNARRGWPIKSITHSLIINRRQRHRWLPGIIDMAYRIPDLGKSNICVLDEIINIIMCCQPTLICIRLLLSAAAATDDDKPEAAAASREECRDNATDADQPYDGRREKLFFVCKYMINVAIVIVWYEFICDDEWISIQVQIPIKYNLQRRPLIDAGSLRSFVY